MSTSAVSAAAVWENAVTKVGFGSGGPMIATAAQMRECIGWLERLERGEFVAVNLNDATEKETE
ncbi:MAG: hypothetical protein LC797_24060 [Chloroflexi bacterium]|nr:hypothetical protein [Chloroflexota bacterium]